MTDTYDLQRRIDRLERLLCERFGHSWPEHFNLFCGADGADYYMRVCRLCGRNEHRTLAQGNGPTPHEVAQ